MKFVTALDPRHGSLVEAHGNQATLTDDEYYEKEYRNIGHCHGKNFRLGDSVPTRVARINAFHSAIDFQLAQTS